MKKLLPILSILALFTYGCSDGKDQASATGSGAGFERQEEDTSDQPGFEKQNYKMDDANITTPIDSRPDLEEED